MRHKTICLHEASDNKPVFLDADDVVGYARRGSRTIVRLEIEVRELPREIAAIIKDA